MKIKNTVTMYEGLKAFIYACNEAFLKEYKLDPIDVNILDNYTDFLVERMEILFTKIKEN